MRSGVFRIWSRSIARAPTGPKTRVTPLARTFPTATRRRWSRSSRRPETGRSHERPLPIAVVARAASGESPPPGIKFATYGPGYASKPDFAQVEHEFPLAPTDLARLTPDNLKGLDQEQIDQIYARLTAGPIPDGPYDGGLFFPKGVSGDKRIAEIIGGLPGLAAQVKTE